jgi:hypothetical protein
LIEHSKEDFNIENPLKWITTHQEVTSYGMVKFLRDF